MVFSRKRELEFRALVPILFISFQHAAVPVGSCKYVTTLDLYAMRTNTYTLPLAENKGGRVIEMLSEHSKFCG